MPEYKLGIDVSKWQRPAHLDWSMLAVIDKIEFSIARATYGTRSDKHFREHFVGARNAGMFAGAYHFYRQTQPWETQLEAFLGELDRVQFGDPDGPSTIVPVVDLEWNEKYDGKVNPDVFNTEARDLVSALGTRFGRCMVYLAPGFYQTLRKPQWLLNYPWWIAHYTTKPEPWCPWKNWHIWQHTGTGRLKGYAGGDIDLNRAVSLPFTTLNDQPTDDDPTRDPAKFTGVQNALQEAVQEGEEAIRAMQAALDKIKELDQ